MTLEEYWNTYIEHCSNKHGEDTMTKFKGIPIVVAPLVAAGHKCKMPVGDLSVFINKFREIDDVTSRLALREITAEKIDEITKAFQSGCTYSKGSNTTNISKV